MAAGRDQGSDERDEVRLNIPALPEFVRLARLTATGLASRIGFTFDAVEDLRLAIDELCFTLVGKTGQEGQLRLRYISGGDALEVRAELVGGAGREPKLSDWSDQILRALVDEHEVSGGSPGASFRLLKRRVVG